MFAFTFEVYSCLIIGLAISFVSQSFATQFGVSDADELTRSRVKSKRAVEAPVLRDELSCEEILATRSYAITLPRELRLSEDSIRALSSEAKDAQFLISLSEIFELLKREENSSSLVRVVGDAMIILPKIRERMVQNPFFAERPELISEQASQIYANLLYSDYVSQLSPYALGLFSYLLRSVAVYPPKSELRDKREDGVNTLMVRRFAPRLRAALTNPRYVHLLEQLFASPEELAHLSVQTRMDIVVPPGLLQKLSRGRKLSMDDVDTFVVLIWKVLVLAEFTEGAGLDVTYSDQDGFYNVERRGLHVALEHYVAINHLLANSLGSFADLVDEVFFEASPRVFGIFEIYGIALESAKTLLLPLKNKVRSVQPEPKLNLVGKPFETMPPVVLKDFFEPKKSVAKIRQSSNSNETGTPVQVKPQGNLGPPLPNGMEDSLDNLKAGIVYYFEFKREEKKSVQQKVRFRESVVDWIKENPESGNDFLSALALGRGPMTGQSGIKFVKQRSKRVNSRIFEVKIFGPYRMLLFQNEGIWEAVKIVHKDDFDREVSDLH